MDYGAENSHFTIEFHTCAPKPNYGFVLPNVGKHSANAAALWLFPVAMRCLLMPLTIQCQAMSSTVPHFGCWPCPGDALPFYTAAL